MAQFSWAHLPHFFSFPQSPIQGQLNCFRANDGPAVRPRTANERRSFAVKPAYRQNHALVLDGNRFGGFLEDHSVFFKQRFDPTFEVSLIFRIGWAVRQHELRPAGELRDLFVSIIRIVRQASP
jgi:hypothetical protein